MYLLKRKESKEKIQLFLQDTTLFPPEMFQIDENYRHRRLASTKKVGKKSGFFFWFLGKFIVCVCECKYMYMHASIGAAIDARLHLLFCLAVPVFVCFPETIHELLFLHRELSYIGIKLQIVTFLL